MGKEEARGLPEVPTPDRDLQRGAGLPTRGEDVVESGRRELRRHVIRAARNEQGCDENGERCGLRPHERSARGGSAR